MGAGTSLKRAINGFAERSPEFYNAIIPQFNERGIAYQRDDHILDRAIPVDVPIPAIPEVQRMLEDNGAAWLAVADVSLSNPGNAIIRAAAQIDEQAALYAIGTTEEITATLEDGKVRSGDRYHPG